MILNDQELFWQGSFGDEYIERNNTPELLANKTSFYGNVITKMCDKIDSCIEFGSNIGLNLIAIQRLLPSCECSAVEINHKAVQILKKNVKVHVYKQSIIDFKPDFQRDLVFIHGVLIHINPADLKKVYEVMYKSSRQYILITEYYNPKPVAMDYRGHNEKLFKRDFAGELMDTYKDLMLIDYGFVYHRDNQFPMDDLNWFLLKKCEGGRKKKC